MTLFLMLLLVHFIGDFYTQKDEWINCKIKNKHRSLGLFKHICVHLILTSLVVFIFSKQSLHINVLAIGVIVGTHYLIDIWKTYQHFTLFSFCADQLAHLLVLTFVSFWLNDMTATYLLAFVSMHWQFDYLVIPIVYLFAFKPVSLLLFLILRSHTQQIEKTDDTTQGLKNAGEHIGYLERGLIITFVLMDSFTSVGFLLAAKSVFRFGDMRRESDRKLTEYIMLGTLFSFSFAIIIGQIAKYLITIL